MNHLSGLLPISVRGAEVESAAFEHDETDEVVEVPVSVADWKIIRLVMGSPENGTGCSVWLVLVCCFP